MAGSTETGAPNSCQRELKLTADELVDRLLSLAPSLRLSLLDSCGARGAGAHLLIAGFDPFEVIEVRDGQARISSRSRQSDAAPIIESEAFSLLDERLERYGLKTSGSMPHAGACIATLSYDLVHRLERLRRRGSATPLPKTEPDAVYAFYDVLVIHDYALRRTVIVGRDRGRIDEAAEILQQPGPEPAREEIIGAAVASSNLSRDEYLSAVRRIKEHIAAGDIYQANLTQQFVCQLPTGFGPEQIFLSLRRHHPAPFAAFIRRREDTVVSISPERFLRVEGGAGERHVEAWPIKGTRPRGATVDEDARFGRELQASEKDRAENVMIVDLLRNDLGRVCRYGTVRVVELCGIEEHPTLFHLVSKVSGRLREEVSAGQLLRACFPCGSITGAPKIRAMEIIDEVEAMPRGLSMGALGYFAFDGAIDLSVAIRTMTVRDGVARFNVGGGIVADSDPALEYEESLTKARALFRALGVNDSGPANPTQD